MGSPWFAIDVSQNLASIDNQFKSMFEKTCVLSYCTVWLQERALLVSLAFVGTEHFPGV